MKNFLKEIQSKRILSFLLAVLMVFSTVQIVRINPAANTASSVAYNGTKISDKSTMDDWKDLFLKNPLNTENSGAVWTDKSVFTNADAFKDAGITMKDEKSFLVALSAIASNQSVTGLSNAPTDTMMILDLSSSMYGNSSKNPATVQAMLKAVNNSITKLQDLNVHNRVGVVVYFGGPDLLQSKSNNSIVMLPLDRYTGTNDYIVANLNTNGTLYSVGVNSKVRNSNNQSVTSSATTRVIASVAGTYAQLGILDAMNQFLNADEKVIPSDASFQPDVERVPIFMFMSDGEPTAATANFSNKVNATWGNNTVSTRSPSQSDFVTQLTASYAKEMVDKAYVTTTPLFYTLSLGTSISKELMDPSNYTNDTIDSYWNTLTTKGQVSFKVGVSKGQWDHTQISTSVTVNRTTIDGVAFPSSVSQREYVDLAFTAETADNLNDAFENIVKQINLQSKYYPTLVEGDEDLDGYVSFVDKIGEYMEVVDIKGILIGDVLFSGKDIASNFVTGGGNLGTESNPTALGDELVWAVMARLGISDASTARTLITNAYQARQLYYNSSTGEYSNYIGWYADASGKYLGFYDDSSTSNSNEISTTAQPYYIVKSYGYLGMVDEGHGVTESDMMYVTVQVREVISTGEQQVIFAVPAALIPLLNYEVVLDENGNMQSLTVSGAESPIRLVYEVALKEGIDEYTITDPAIVSPEYIKKNTNQDGSVNFYTNQYETDNTTGYGKVNTYSYFRPSHQNSKYYYTSNETVYTDKNGTVYNSTTAPDPDGTYYHTVESYSENGVVITYERFSKENLQTAIKNSDNTWYIPHGNVCVVLDGETVDKSNNETSTLTYAYQPFVDIYGHSVNEINHRFVVGATLGNNGRLSIQPATGIAIYKTVEGTDDGSTFEFVITGSSDDANKTYEARKVDADNNVTDVQVSFDANGKATVNLKNKERIYISGMTAGSKYTVSETETVEWTIVSVNGDTSLKSTSLTLVNGTFSEARFVNTQRGVGSLTVTKDIVHNLGTDYQIPDLEFEISVNLSGIGTASQTFKAVHSGDDSVTTVTTDENGNFSIVLAYGEQFEIDNIPNETIATVIEANPGTGFEASYYENGHLGDGVVEINGIKSVVVRNTYDTPDLKPTNLVVGGTKYFIDEDNENAVWTNEVFTFILQEYKNGEWVDVDTQTVTNNNRSFLFDTSSIIYTAPGVYSYQVFEVEPENEEDKYDGVFYDNVWHTFYVTVTDADMDGELEISKITSAHSGKEFEMVNGVWTITTDFTNVQYVTSPVLAYVDTQKVLNNPSNSPLVSLAGYTFGLYTDVDCKVEAQIGNGLTKIDIAPTDAVGEGWIDMVFDKSGVYTYYLKEIVGVTPNMTYSQRVVKVTVTVEDAAGGTLTADVTCENVIDDFGNSVTGDALNADGEVEFYNSYNPDIAELEILANKTLHGRDMTENEFDFEICYASSGETVVSGKNAAALNGEKGKITFGTLTYDKVGTYHYDVIETSVDKNGVTTDKQSFHVIVTVIDNNGKLEASYIVTNLVSNVIEFENIYEPSPTEYTISGTKELIGKNLVVNEFTFLLTETDKEGNSSDNSLTYTVTNDVNGRFQFPTLTFDEVGVYYYTVTEIHQLEENGVIYDDAVFTVVITVTDDGLGALSATAEINDNNLTEIKFVNTYIPEPTTVLLHGNKSLVGKDLNEGDYSFELYSSDANWGMGELIETVKNGPDGHFDFEKVGKLDPASQTYIFDETGSYYYLIKEKDGGLDENGIIYDARVYRVKIEITDNLRGNLVSNVTIFDEEGNVQADANFVNTYRIYEKDTDAVIEGTKVLTGLDLVDGMFNFELYAADSNFTMGELLATTANKDGKFQFNVTYTQDDVAIGKFYYVVKEENAGKTINGITYSDATYNVEVTLSDNGDGTYSVSVQYLNGEIVFENNYNYENTSVSLSGTKELTGRDMTANEFSFELYSADANFSVTELLQTVNNNANGIFQFSDLTFTEAGNYYYVVKENNDNPLGGVTYDETQYFITITVEDNNKGNLVVTAVEITDNNGNTADEITFVNTYEAKETEIILEGTKELIGRDLNENEFSFNLFSASEGFYEIQISQIVKNDINGKFSFDAITFTEAGSYYFLLVENVEQKLGGVTYDETRYYITVTIEDDGIGNLVVTSTEMVDNNGNTADEIKFVNTYEAKETEIVLNGTKELIGRDLTENEFSFELYSADSNFSVTELLQTVKNDAEGKFSFEAINFTEAGNYYFIVEENNDNPLGGVTYDETQYFITITVTDDGEGNLVATKSITATYEEITPDIIFVNTYSSDKISVSLNGTKELVGRDLTENEFSFELYSADSNFSVTELLQTVKNDAEGKFKFDSVEFTEAGNYYFIVKENNDNPLGGVTYDETQYFIEIIVEDDGNGNLVIASKTIETDNGDTATEIKFVNTYEAKLTNLDFNGDKTLVNGVLAENQFKFMLYQTNQDFALNGATLLGTATNDADGKFAFETLTFDQAGVYYFVICEEINNSVEDIIFDQRQYLVTVTVTDDGLGNLVATKEINVDNKAYENIEFVNTVIEIPDTGDKGMTPWVILFVASGLALVGLTVFDKKRKAFN